MSWHERSFEELVDFYDHMRVPLSKLVREERQGEFLYYGAQGVIDQIDDYIFDGEYVLIAEDGANLVTRKQPISRLARGQFWVNNHAHIVRAKEGVSTNEFVNILVNSTNLTGYVTGVAQPKLSQNNLRRAKFRAPDFRIQVEISNIISAYEKLIENNRRRIQLLEQSARLLYKEWFVHLRFPGHEHVSSVNGIPIGWKIHRLSDLCHIGRGASPRPINKYMDGEVPWFKIGDATASESPFVFETKERVTEQGARKSILMAPGSLLLSNSATCGFPYFAGVAGCVHDGWLHFKNHHRLNREFLYCFLFSRQKELLQVVSDGSTQKNLNTSVVGNLTFPLPPDDSILDLFGNATIPIFSMIFTLAKQNLALRNARDLLLPRLMNGDIPI